MTSHDAQEPIAWFERSEHRRRVALIVAAGGSVAAVAGGVIAAATSTVWAIVVFEVAAATVLIAVATAIGLLLGDWRHRGHDDASSYSPGDRARLDPAHNTGLTDPLVACVAHDGSSISELRVHEHPNGDDDDVVAAIIDDHPNWLEAAVDGTGSGALRMTDGGEDDGPSAVYATDEVERWTLTLAHRTMVFESPRGRRPEQRTLRDVGTAEAFLIRRGRRGLTGPLTATLPGSFTSRDVVFVLWLVHLLDVRAETGTDGWWVPRDGTRWAIPASLGFRLGPGGFGDRFMSSAS